MGFSLRHFIDRGNKILKRRRSRKDINDCYNMIFKEYTPGNIKCMLYSIDNLFFQEMKNTYKNNIEDMGMSIWLLKGLIRYALINSGNIKTRYFLGSSSKNMRFASRVKIVACGTGHEIIRYCNSCYLKIFCTRNKNIVLDPSKKYMLLMVEDIVLDDNSLLSDKIDEALSNVRFKKKNMFKKIWVSKLEFKTSQS